MKINNLVLRTKDFPEPGNDVSFEATLWYMARCPTVKKAIFNEPATIILWEDGTKTVVRCAEGEKYDKFVGLAMCFLKKLSGSDYPRIRNEIRKYE